VVIPIEEGPRFKIGRLAVKGAMLASEREHLKLLGLRKGQVFNRSSPPAWTAGNSSTPARANPNIEPQTNVNVDKKLVDLAFEIGPP
jgi:outer membrane protein assembly factor BamA